MSTANRKLLLSCLVFTVVICLCLSAISIIGAGILLVERGGFQLREGEPSVATNTPASVEEQMDLIEAQVAQLRGLSPKTSVTRYLLTPEELQQKVLDDFLEDYSLEDAQEDALILWGFGLLNRDFDLYNFYIELYNEQIAGYYDQETKAMYVVQEDTFKGPERLTYAHEFVHALQDQYYDIQNGLKYNDEVCKEDSERCAAISGLLEGDASLTESQWFSKFATQNDQLEISEFYRQFESPVYDRAPAFMQQDFLFPYQQGQTFVQSLYEQGGWEAVNQAYLEPPVSTEQILHPEQYPEDLPIPIEVPGLESLLGAGWQEIDRGVMGEWYTYLILSAGLEREIRISQNEAQRAAAGWEGDTYVVLYNPELDQISLLLFTRWNSTSDAAEFRQAFEKYALRRFSEEASRTADRTMWQSSLGMQAFYIQDEFTAWITAPDEETIASIWEQLPKP